MSLVHPDTAVFDTHVLSTALSLGQPGIARYAYLNKYPGYALICQGSLKLSDK